MPACDLIDPLFIVSFWSLQWRFSRVVEPSASLPKDKAFSIAAALPMPCYGSLVDDLSGVCLHSEEQLPFSQNEHSAQHIAQQLTLLQQVDTHACTIHFPSFVLKLLFSVFTTRGRHAVTNCIVRPRLLHTTPSDIEVVPFCNTGNVPRMSPSSFPQLQNTRSQGQSLDPKQVSRMFQLLCYIQMGDTTKE